MSRPTPSGGAACPPVPNPEAPSPVRCPGTPDAARRAALRALRDAGRDLLRGAAAAHAAGLLDADDLRALRAELKQGRRVRLLRPGAMRALARKYASHAEAFRFDVAELAPAPAPVPAPAIRAVLGAVPNAMPNAALGAVLPPDVPNVPGVPAAPGAPGAPGAVKVRGAPTAPAGPGAGSGAGRVDELPKTQSSVVARKYRLVTLIEDGWKVAEALAKTGLEYTERAVRLICRRYRERGFDGLLDGRRGSKSREASVMTPQVQRIVFTAWMERPAAGPKAVHSAAARACVAAGLRPPKYHSVWRFLARQELDVQLLRAGKLETLAKEHTPVVRFQMATCANERHLWDHSLLKVWGKKWDPRGVLVPTRVWITASLDAYSRAIPGFVLSTESPNAWQVALMLRHAILPKRDPRWLNQGKPGVVQPDQGRDFMSDDVDTTCAALRIRIDPDPPYYPNRKGKIERWFRTLDAGCIRLLPGHKATGCVSEEAAAKRLDELLFVHEIRAEVERWIVEDYHARVHRELDPAVGRTPAEAWDATVGVPAMPESEDALNLLLLKTEERTVSNVGLEFRRERYWSPVLASCIGRKVCLRYDPDDEASVLVYDAATSRFLCEAHVMGRPASLYATGDVQRSAREAHAGLLARTKARMDVAAQQGRQRDAARAGRDLADALRRDPAAPTPAAAAAPPRTPAEVEADALLARLEAAAGDDAGGDAAAGEPEVDAAAALDRATAEIRGRLDALADDDAADAA